MAFTADRVVGVPVDGGELSVGVWGDGGPVSLLVHGVTASHRGWLAVADALRGHGTVLAPDLRGRGASAGLPGPYGMAAHARDCVAVLDAFDAADAVVAGHSMGGFVSVVLAHLHPERVRRLVLVDGGPPPPPPPGDTPQEQLANAIGPAAARLSMRFESVETYRDFWRRHPAFAEWTPLLESYVDYDLTGEPPELRSRVDAAAVEGDSTDLFAGDALPSAWAALHHDAVFLRAERGMLDQVPPFYADPAAIAERIEVRTVPDTNHYTICLGEHGAAAVAEAVRG